MAPACRSPAAPVPCRAARLLSQDRQCSRPRPAVLSATSSTLSASPSPVSASQPTRSPCSAWLGRSRPVSRSAAATCMPAAPSPSWPACPTCSTVPSPSSGSAGAWRVSSTCIADRPSDARRAARGDLACRGHRPAEGWPSWPGSSRPCPWSSPTSRRGPVARLRPRDVGIAERPERILVLGAALLFGVLEIGLWVLVAAIGGHGRSSVWLAVRRQAARRGDRPVSISARRGRTLARAGLVRGLEAIAAA